MPLVWDYNKKAIAKTESGRILLLERLINFGPKKEKIKKTDIKKYWTKLQLFPKQKRLLELLLWGKRSSRANKSLF
ncbi:hypothetical protein HY947_06835 [Candidatus Gottesmanbacteria bacterium]|nr:hypothetical protein [Candidatus Gottesmanbacteria bacterium]